MQTLRAEEKCYLLLFLITRHKTERECVCLCVCLYVCLYMYVFMCECVDRRACVYILHRGAERCDSDHPLISHLTQDGLFYLKMIPHNMCMSSHLLM